MLKSLLSRRENSLKFPNVSNNESVCVCVCGPMPILMAFPTFEPRFTGDRGASLTRVLFLRQFGGSYPIVMGIYVGDDVEDEYTFVILWYNSRLIK